MSRARFGYTRQVVPRVGRHHEGLVPQAQQIVLAHQPQHAFVIHREAAAVQLDGDPAVAVGGELQRDLLHRIAQLHLYRDAWLRQAPTIVTGPADAGQLAQRVHGFAFRRGLSDFLKQAASPLATAGG